MQTTSKELTISWQKANDPTPVTYKLSIFDETCSSEIYSKEIKDALNHTVAANNILSAATTYCLKIEARDLAKNKRNATNNSIKFVTATDHSVEAGPDLIVTTDVNISGASSAGSSLSFEWTSSNPSVVSFSDATILNPVVTVTSDGIYTLQLKSTEGINNTVLTDTLTLIKDTTPPVLADLADETSTLGVGFSKTADVTDESSGLASGLWEKVLGTGNVVFSNPTATTTTITPDTASGSYTIRYTATDNAGLQVVKLLLLSGIFLSLQLTLQAIQISTQLLLNL